MASVRQAGLERPGMISTMQQPNPVKVLLVEDSPMLAERLGELVAQIPGVDIVATVDDEQRAVDEIRAQAIDAVILDLQLKRGTGFGVLRKIANLPTRPIVIIYTNYALPEYRRQAEAMGVSYFLDKSRDYDRLSDVLREIGQQAA